MTILFSLLIEYTDIDGDEAIPLGKEFQQHVKSFMCPDESTLKEKMAPLTKVVEQLGYEYFTTCSLILFYYSPLH